MKEKVNVTGVPETLNYMVHQLAKRYRIQEF